jgi:hypothetical protein
LEAKKSTTVSLSMASPILGSGEADLNGQYAARSGHLRHTKCRSPSDQIFALRYDAIEPTLPSKRNSQAGFWFFRTPLHGDFDASNSLA